MAHAAGVLSALARGPKGIFVSFGPGAVNVMKTALTVKKAAFEVVVNRARVGKLAAAFGKEAPAGFDAQDELFQAPAVSIGGGKELRINLSTNLQEFAGAGTWFTGAPAPK